ncbi:MAG: T9SS type A sorting domain-containing protein [Bacteroidetes bacterium]|nr:T9SS type A sorting domain-containing protein [Bacteroidota bacterium]
MRTIYITLIGILLSINAVAQISSDTTYSKEWNKANEEWIYFDRIISNYENNVLVSELIQVYEYTEWINYNERNYFYNNGQLIVEKENYWDDRHNEWIENYRKLYEYDQAGKLLTITHQNIFNGMYFDSSREIMKYSADGKLIEKEVQTNEEAWTKFLKYQYYYNANDLLMEENLTYWENDQWGEVSFKLMSHYDKNGNLVDRVKTKLNGRKEIKLIREEFVYNQADMLTEQIVSEWSQMKKQWNDKNRAVYASDLNGYVCSLMNQNKDKKAWINYLFTEFTGTNEPVTGLELADGMTFSVYPVNFGQMAKIEFNNPYNEEYFVKVINENGQLVGSASTTNNEVAIDAKHLIKGIYFIELQGSNLFSGKFSIK